MEKLRALNQTDGLYIKYCKKNDTDVVPDGSPVALTHNQYKRTINRLRAELDKANFKYQAVFKSTRNYNLILDKQLNIVDFSESYAALLNNLSDKPLQIGNNIANYLTPGLMLDVAINCREVINGKTTVVEREVLLRNKQSTWWMVEYSPAYNAVNQIAGVVLNITDVTDRKMHELKIQLQNRKLREISLIQSHELRGPLCTLMGLIDLIKMEGAINNTEYIDAIDATMKMLDKSIRHIVDCASEDNR